MARARSRRRPPNRGRGSTRRRSSRASSRGDRAGLLVVAVLVGLLATNWLADRPGLLIALVVALLAGLVGAAVLWLVWVRSRHRRRAALTRSVAAADRLSGPDFEQWVAELMRRTGFTRVQVSGGAGDLGADIVAVTPTGWRVVVQCKRYQVAGTATAIHEADLATIVTTSSFTAPARDAAARLGIGLVDREALARWAADGLLPLALARPVPPAAGPSAAPPLPGTARATRGRPPRPTR